MKRREVNVLSLAFLDVMSCGFGAAVLFFVIITAATDQTPAVAMDVSSAEQDDLRGERMRAVRELARVQVELEEAKRVEARGAAESERLVAAIDEQGRRLALLQDETLARKDRIERLKADLESRKQANERLSAQSVDPDANGDSLTRFTGDGRRQYLTGLKMGGQRILILVDASGSMLDQTLVNIIRRRNMPRQRQLDAPKWKRAVATVEWLSTRIESKSKFQIYAFDTEARAVLADTDGKWIDAGNGTDLRRAVEALRDTPPRGGTSLHAAFAAADTLEPPPDNIYLLVDGLPTQGRTKPGSATVNGAKRLEYFRDAFGRWESRVPINVILFPMEGDPLAAGAFWELAQVTGGSFMAPSRDWP